MNQLNTRDKDSNVNCTSPLSIRLITVILLNCKEYSNKIAIEDENQIITYSDLLSSSNRIIPIIKECKDSTLVIFSQRDYYLPIIVFSVLRTGIPFIIVDPKYPDDKIRTIINEFSTKKTIICTDTSVQDFILEDGYDEKITIDRKLLFGKKHQATTFDYAEELDGVAYYLATSGSTGKPKIVVNTLEPLAYFINWYVSKYDFDSTDNFSMISGLSHDPIFRDIFTPLFSGGTISIPNDSIIRNPHSLLSFIYEKKISIMHLTPAHIQILLMGDNTGSYSKSIKRFFIGGDKLTKNLVEEIYKEFHKKINITNCYGATETPQIIACYDIERGHIPQTDVMPIGKGRSDCRIQIMKDGTPCREGDTGEIVIESNHLSIGYLNNDVLTDNRFRVITASDNDMAQLYYTGDFGRKIDKANILCTGRFDNQVKVNGVRIELNEIDGYISQIEDVLSNITLVQKKNNKNLLVCFYISKSGNDINIKDDLKKKIASNSLPSLYIRMDEFPLTPNGKIDKQKLLIQNHNKSIKLDGPSSNIAERFFPFAKGTSVSDSDTFVTLGGDSLSFIQSSMLIEKELGYIPDNWENLSIKDLGKLKKKDSRVTKIECQEIIRALSIILIVFGHLFSEARWFNTSNTSILLFISGFNYARFHGKRIREKNGKEAVIKTLKNLLLPYYIFLFAYQIFKKNFHLPDILLYTIYVRNDNGVSIFPIWYIQILCHCIILFTIAFYIFHLIKSISENDILIDYLLFLIFLSMRLFIPMIDGLWASVPHMKLWLIALGWLTYYSMHNPKMKKTIFLTLLLVYIYTIYNSKEFIDIEMIKLSVACILVVFFERIPIFKEMKSIIQIIASSSYYIFLSHFIFFNLLENTVIYNSLLLTTVIAITGGIISKYAIEYLIYNIKNGLSSVLKKKEENQYE